MIDTNIRLALFSPNRNAFSESFIQAHRNIVAKVFFYYGGTIPTSLEDHGDFSLTLESLKCPFTILKRIFNPALLTYPNSFSLKQRLLAYSLKKHKINMVLAEYGLCAADTLPVCCYLKIPLIAHFHGYDISVRNIVNAYADKYIDLFAYAAKIVVVSRQMENTIISMGCPQEKILYNPCGPNDRLYNIQPTYQSNQVLCIGRYVNKKAPYNTILAFKKVLEMIPDAKLIMIGDGVLYEACYNIAQNIGILDAVDFKGVVGHDEIDGYIKNSTVFVQSSVVAFDGDKEGTPVAVMEASLAGLPVVSTEHAGIPDVVIDGKTGIILKEHDISGMANAIVELLRDKTLARRMGLAGKEFINANFSLSKSLSNLNNLIIQCCK